MDTIKYATLQHNANNHVIVSNMGSSSAMLDINAAKRHIELNDRRIIPVVGCLGGQEFLLMERISIIVNTAKMIESTMDITPNTVLILA